MIDPTTAPIVAKAVDFLFDQGRLFLEDWRSRRQSKSPDIPEPRDTTNPVTPTRSTSDISPDPVIATKEEALRAKVEQSLVAAKEQEIAHLLRLVEVHSGNYHRAKEQEAQWGALAVPPFISNTVNTEGAALDEAIERLRDTVSGVYGKQIVLL